MHQPGTLNVVSVALQMTCTSRPIHLEEKIQMMGLRIKYLISEDSNDVAQGCLYPIDCLLRNEYTHREHSSQNWHIIT